MLHIVLSRLSNRTSSFVLDRLYYKKGLILGTARVVSAGETRSHSWVRNGTKSKKPTMDEKATKEEAPPDDFHHSMLSPFYTPEHLSLFSKK